MLPRSTKSRQLLAALAVQAGLALLVVFIWVRSLQPPTEQKRAEQRDSSSAPATASTPLAAGAASRSSPSQPNPSMADQIAGGDDGTQHPKGTTGSFVYTFDGKPGQPTAFSSTNWDIAIHSRDTNTWQQLEPMTAEHDMNCGAPPAQHAQSGNYRDAVFICRDHIMTAINASGYGVIYLTPNQLLDFGRGEAVIRWEMSTQRTSFRDWTDVWITPYDDNVQLPFDDGDVDLQGVPRRAVRVKLDSANGNGTALVPTVYNDFQPTADFKAFSDDYKWGLAYESFLTPSAQRRDVFEIRLSQTHLKVGMPAYNQWWVDKDITPLDWTRAVVQFGHHSYNPSKSDSCAVDQCHPTTWHWDNIALAPATPFTIIPAKQRFLNPDAPAASFTQPAPADSYIRFSGIGHIEISFDGGQSWQPARKQPSSVTGEQYHAEHMSNYWMPVPPGTQNVQLRFSADDWYQGPFIAKDFTFWSLAP